MATTDEAVLMFIGRGGCSPGAIAERFPGFDVMRLVRAHLVDVALVDDADAVGHVQRGDGDPVLGEMRCVLTDRGAAAVGLG
jgi:hypothetical protein